MEQISAYELPSQVCNYVWMTHYVMTVWQHVIVNQSIWNNIQFQFVQFTAELFENILMLGKNKVKCDGIFLLILVIFIMVGQTWIVSVEWLNFKIPTLFFYKLDQLFVFQKLLCGTIMWVTAKILRISICFIDYLWSIIHTLEL